MPADDIGQKITFATQIAPDEKFVSYVYVRAQKNDTIARIAARKGHPEMVKIILGLNSDVRLPNGHFLRSGRQALKAGTLIRLPGTLRSGDQFSVHADDPRPTIRAGYAKYDTVDRPGRVGINRFLGYDPIEMDIPVQFEGYAATNDNEYPTLGNGVAAAGSALLELSNLLTGNQPIPPGVAIEASIAVLERMAGRGNYAGAAEGPPAVIRVSCTGNDPNASPVWLIPSNYQYSPQNPTAPLWRITNIAWAGNDQSDLQGRRIRSKAVITVKQYTPLTQIKRSATQRSRAKKTGSKAGSSITSAGTNLGR